MPQGTWLIIGRFLKNIYLFMYLFSAVLGLTLLHRLFSRRGEWRLLCSFGVWASPCGSFSCCGAWTLGPVAFSSCSVGSVGVGPGF